MTPYEWMQEELKKGIKEIPGISKNNPRIIWYHAHTTLKATTDEVPWCSSVMCAAHEACGIKSTRSAAAISWETFGEEVKLEDAEPGDVVVIKRSSASNPKARHVTFLHNKIRPGDKNFLGLGGNQSNAIRVSKYPVSEITTIRRLRKA